MSFFPADPNQISPTSLTGMSPRQGRAGKGRGRGGAGQALAAEEDLSRSRGLNERRLYSATGRARACARTDVRARQTAHARPR